MTKYQGYTRIRPRALEHLAQYVASDALRVDPDDLSVDLRDSGTKLGIAISAGIRDDDLQLATTSPDTTLFTVADRAIATIAQRLAGLSGYTIGDIDLRFTHIVDTTPERRVR